MGTVAGAEGVVDVAVGELRQTVAECVVGLAFPRLETHVLQQHHVARDRLAHHPRGLVSGHVGGPEAHVARQQLAEPCRHRRQRQIGVGLPAGPSPVGARDDDGVPFEQPLQRGQGRPDAVVVVDLAVADRHVEVAAHEDSRATRHGQVFQLR